MTTAVLPVGPIENACIGTVNFNSCDSESWVNSTSDYITICCDGGIINTAWSIWSPGANLSSKPWVLDDFACCERDIWSTPDITTCSEGIHQTALASLAGTNTDNFQYWTDTYLTDMAQTPRCGWFSVGSEVTTVEVARQTGKPDTTKVTESSTTISGSRERSSAQSVRETATESETTVATSQATPIPTSVGTGVTGIIISPSAALSTSHSRKLRASWRVLATLGTTVAAYMIR